MKGRIGLAALTILGAAMVWGWFAIGELAIVMNGG